MGYINIIIESNGFSDFAATLGSLTHESFNFHRLFACCIRFFLVLVTVADSAHSVEDKESDRLVALNL
jgi:hypothetical protein